MNTIIDCEHWLKVFLFVNWQSIHTFSSRQCQRRQLTMAIEHGDFIQWSIVKFNVVCVVSNLKWMISCQLTAIDGKSQWNTNHFGFWLPLADENEDIHSGSVLSLFLSLERETRMQMSQRLIKHNDLEYERTINSIWEYGRKGKKVSSYEN